eukprot:scaffold5825_cov62-Cyclotella_meneghiniana.AAC.1
MVKYHAPPSTQPWHHTVAPPTMTVPPTQLPPLTTQHLDQNVRVLEVYYAYLEKVLTQSSTLLPIELTLRLELGRYLISDKPMTNKVRSMQQSTNSIRR